MSRENRKSGVQCCITNCKRSKRNSPGVRLFQFPPRPEGQIWHEACNIKEPRENILICDRHFDPNVLGKRRLKSGAFPTLFLGLSNEDSLDEESSHAQAPVKSKECSESSDGLEAKCSSCEEYAKQIFELKTIVDRLTIEMEKKTEQISNDLPMHPEHSPDVDSPSVENVSQGNQVKYKIVDSNASDSDESQMKTRTSAETTLVDTSHDEYSVFGIYVANTLRNCPRNNEEIFKAQHDIHNIMYNLYMGTYKSSKPGAVSQRTMDTDDALETSQQLIHEVIKKEEIIID